MKLSFKTFIYFLGIGVPLWILSCIISYSLIKREVDDEFKESILEDTQLNEATITYSNEEDDHGILKIELHIRNGENRLRSVYMERNDEGNGISRIRKIFIARFISIRQI